MLKNYATNLSDNGYWYTLLKAYARFGEDLNSNFEAAINSLTPESVATFARTHLQPKTHLHLTMNPE
jgi:zinc protease